jgi:hypothetical protein
MLYQDSLITPYLNCSQALEIAVLRWRQYDVASNKGYKGNLSDLLRGVNLSGCAGTSDLASIEPSLVPALTFTLTT